MLQSTQARDDRVYFQVLISFEDIEEKKPRTLESKAISTIDEAEGLIKNTVDQLATKYPESDVIQLQAKELSDDDKYHIIVKDKDSVLARLGIVQVDYSHVTIH